MSEGSTTTPAPSDKQKIAIDELQLKRLEGAARLAEITLHAKLIENQAGHSGPRDRATRSYELTLTSQDANELRAALMDLLMAEGLQPDDEPNQLGFQIEALVDVLSFG